MHSIGVLSNCLVSLNQKHKKLNGLWNGITKPWNLSHNLVSLSWLQNLQLSYSTSAIWCVQYWFPIGIYTDYNCYRQSKCDTSLLKPTWNKNKKKKKKIKELYLSVTWLKKIIWVIGVLRRTVVSDWRFDNLCGSHLQSQVGVLVSWKFKNPGERFDWSTDRVVVGNYVMWLAVKTCAEIGYANRWIVKWIINKVLLFPVE